MADRFVVSMLMLHYGTPRDQQAREELAAALGDAEVTDDHKRRRADTRTRTGDPFITSEVLYQLSYVGAGAKCSRRTSS